MSTPKDLGPFIAQEVRKGSPFADWAELVGIVAKERDDALAEVARLEGLLMVYRPVYEAVVAQRESPMVAAILGLAR